MPGGPPPATPRLRRARLLASTALATCLLLNVWAVAQAGHLDGNEGVSRPVRPTQPTPTMPAPLTVIEKGDGRLTPVAIPGGTLKSAPDGRRVRIAVETEGGLPVNAAEFAAAVATTLSDARGWQRVDKVRFVAVSPADLAKGAKVDVRIALASPETTDRLCAPLRTRGQVSCHSGGRAVINLRRWQLGAEAYGADLAGYRTYVVNHEVGHSLGHGHAFCAGRGKVAPVMMQQTYGLGGCVAWPWPSPKPA